MGDKQAEAGAMQISDVKMIYISHIRKSIVVSGRFLLSDECGTFVKLEPNRNRDIANLITCRCSKEFRTSDRVRQQRFWFGKEGTGKLFLDKLRGLRAAAIKSKFKVKGERFTSRQQQERPGQMMAGVVSVSIPSVGDRVASNVQMRVDSMSLRKNGRYPLWVPLVSTDLDTIAHMAADLFADDGESGGGADDDAAENVEVDGEEYEPGIDIEGDDTADTLTDVSVNSSPSRSDQSSIESQLSSSDSQSLSSVAVHSSPMSPPVQKRSRAQNQLFQAFMKGAAA